MALGSDPIWTETLESEGARITPQALFSRTNQHVLMEVGEGQLSERSINGVTIAKHRVVTLTERSPVTVFFEERHHVIEIRCLSLQIEEEWFMAMEPQSGGSNEGALDTVSTTIP